MLARVVSVRKQTSEEFRAAVRAVRASAGQMEGRQSRPVFHEDESSGDHRAYLAGYEKGCGGLQYLFVARSFVWLKEKGVTVELVFEGQGKMRSKLAQAREKATFEEAAEAIHRSVE